MIDHFQGFNGFAPEEYTKYERFSREQQPVDVARELLRQHKNREICLMYDQVLPEGIKRFEADLTVPEQDEAIAEIFKGIVTDHILIRLYESAHEPYGYVLQRIVVGNQSITQIESVQQN